MTASERATLLSPMSYHHGRADKGERWEEHQNLTLLGKIRSNSGFGVSLSYQDRQAPGLPSLVASDAISAEESRDYRIGNNSGESSTSNLESSSMPGVSQMPPPPPPPSYQPTIEISPGVQVRLRGADETRKAIENDFYMPAECICCESTIFCIQNADYILCPDCRVVSRMEDLSSHEMGGVGLGFKYEDLARWQEAILRDQTC
jgi:hypothetical protein